MHRLKEMKDCLVSCVQAQLADINHVDTHELGEAIDMIKDLEQAMYYCSIVKEMEEKKEEEKKMEEFYHMRDLDRHMGKMYYTPDWRLRDRDRETGKPYDYYEDKYREDDGKKNPYKMPYERDSREGRSPVSRRHYMESKELHKDKADKIRELEKYCQELSDDIVEMIEDASPEERQMLEKKMTHLTSKIAQLNV